MPTLSPTPFLHPDTAIAGSTFGAYTEIGQGTRLRNTAFGDYSYCDRFCDIANTHVGKFANIASAVRIGATDHPLGGASLHHFQYRASYYWPDEPDDAPFFARRDARLTVIGHDTWIGHGALIKPDVTVGDGAVVGQGAVVTRDVAPYTIVAGNPARVIRHRQPPETADRLIALRWWDWDHNRLRRALTDFRTLSAADFLNAYEGT